VPTEDDNNDREKLTEQLRRTRNTGGGALGLLSSKGGAPSIRGTVLGKNSRPSSSYEDEPEPPVFKAEP
jgi:hypothetical protein